MVVVLYAAFIGLLLASYVTPIQDILTGREEMPHLQSRLAASEEDVAAGEREVKALNTPEGIERAARERYGMVAPGDRIYIVPDSGRDEKGGKDE